MKDTDKDIIEGFDIIAREVPLIVDLSNASKANTEAYSTTAVISESFKDSKEEDYKEFAINFAYTVIKSIDSLKKWDNYLSRLSDFCKHFEDKPPNNTFCVGLSEKKQTYSEFKQKNDKLKNTFKEYLNGDLHKEILEILESESSSDPIVLELLGEYYKSVNELRPILTGSG